MTPDRSLDTSKSIPVAVDVANWKAFVLPTGAFLLHVPSGHVLQVPELLASVASGVCDDPQAAAELKRLNDTLPRPAGREVKPDIRAISLNMAQGCNLRCTYCFAGDGDYGKQGLMSTAVATAAIALLAKGKPNFHVVFFGGEPLLNFPTIVEVVAWCEEQAYPITFAITTNGTLLNAEKLAWFKRKGFSLNLSYDGPGLTAAQRLRKDHQANAEAAIERKLTSFAEQLTSLKDMRLRATVSRAQLPKLEEALVATLTSRNFKVFLSHHTTSKGASAFTEADIRELGAILHRVVDRFLAVGDYARVLQLDNIKQMVTKIHRGKTGGVACGAGLNYLTVSVSGGFYLCHRFNEDESERFGGIDEGLNSARLAEIAAFRNAKQGPCATCWMREWCAGGCFHEHKSGRGDKFLVDPRFCQLQDQEYAEAMRVYTVLRQQAPHLLEA